jgi:hypothetical protein
MANGVWGLLRLPINVQTRLGLNDCRYYEPSSMANGVLGLLRASHKRTDASWGNDVWSLVNVSST